MAGHEAREAERRGAREPAMPLLEYPSFTTPRRPNPVEHFLARELGRADHCSQCGSTASSSVASDLSSCGSGRELLPLPAGRFSNARQFYNGTPVPVYDDIEGGCNSNSSQQPGKSKNNGLSCFSKAVAALILFLLVAIIASGVAFYFFKYEPDMMRLGTLEQERNKTADTAAWIVKHNSEAMNGRYEHPHAPDMQKPYAFLYGKKPVKDDPSPIAWDTSRRRKPRNTLLRNITLHKIKNDHHLRVHQAGTYRVQTHLCFKVQVNEADVTSIAPRAYNADDRDLHDRGRSKTILHLMVRNCRGSEDEVLKTYKLLYLLPGEEYKYCSDLSGLVAMEPGCSVYVKISSEGEDQASMKQYMEHFEWNYVGLYKL